MFTSLSDIKESNGKTVRENNLELFHLIPIDTLVEVTIRESSAFGSRGYVVGHSRDCDGTPLYILSLHSYASQAWALDGGDTERLVRHGWSGGFGEECLRVIIPTP